MNFYYFAVALVLSCAIFDIKDKAIPLWLLFMHSILTVFLLCLYHDNSIDVFQYTIEACMNGMPGVLLLILAKVLNQKIGYGDGWIILILGLQIGILSVIAVIFLALFSFSIVGLVLMKGYQKEKNNCIPFIPFLVLGLGGVMNIG